MLTLEHCVVTLPIGADAAPLVKVLAKGFSIERVDSMGGTLVYVLSRKVYKERSNK